MLYVYELPDIGLKVASTSHHKHTPDTTEGKYVKFICARSRPFITRGSRRQEIHMLGPAADL